MRQRTVAPLLVGLALTALACPERGREASHETTTITDQEILAPAVAASGEVIRNSTDCAKVVKAAPEAKAALDEASGKVQSAAGRVTIDSLKKQVSAIVDACPAGVN